MSLSKFTTEKRRVVIDGVTWILHNHCRKSEGPSERPPASYLVASNASHRRVQEVTEPRLVRDLCFDKAFAVSKRVDLRALRRAVGAATWSKNRWTPVLRKLLSGVFDMVLVRRALSCAPRVGVAEIGIVPFPTLFGEGKALRIIGDGWRLMVAGRIEERARPIALGRNRASVVRKVKP